jgi:type II secretory pathway pseudopilin PulG
MKGNKGITLIALVITIIVLLILAAVSIAMLTGENSILNRAQESASANALGAAKDAVNLEVTGYVSDYYKEVYVTGNNTVNNKGLTTYVGERIKNELDTNKIGVKDVEVTTHTASSIVLTYKPDGTTVSTTSISNGKVAWGVINKSANN